MARLQESNGPLIKVKVKKSNNSPINKTLFDRLTTGWTSSRI